MTNDVALHMTAYNARVRHTFQSTELRLTAPPLGLFSWRWRQRTETEPERRSVSEPPRVAVVWLSS